MSKVSWLAAMPATSGFTANVSTSRVRTQRTISRFSDADHVKQRMYLSDVEKYAR